METKKMKNGARVMSYDFEYYSGQHLGMPIKPIKPALPRNPSVTDARAFADALEEYELQIEAYRENLDWYSCEKNRLLIEFMDVLQKNYDLSGKAFNLIWSKAFEQGHSGSLHEVYYKFDELYDFVVEWDKQEK